MGRWTCQSYTCEVIVVVDRNPTPYGLIDLWKVGARTGEGEKGDLETTQESSEIVNHTNAITSLHAGSYF